MTKEALKQKYQDKKFIHQKELNNIIKDFNLTIINNSKSETVYRFLNDIYESPICDICGKPKTFRRFSSGYLCMDKNCIKIQANKKRETTNLNKYGKPFISQLDYRKKELNKNNPFAKKAVKEKIKETIKQKYNVDHISKSDLIKKKKQQTLLKHYGVDSPLRIPEIKNKVMQQFKAKYNCLCPANASIIINKSLKTKYKNIYKELCNKATTVKPLFLEAEFIGSKHIYTWQCQECGAIIKKSYHSSRIPICHKCHPVSKAQDDIYKFLKSLDPSLKIIKQTRKIIAPLELDIYIPNLKLAIEYNGSFWHSLKKLNDKNYHLNKTKLCEEKGIKLIHIFEHEWNNKRDIILDIIKNMINKNYKYCLAQNLKLDRSKFNLTDTELNTLGFKIKTHTKPKCILVKKNHLDIYKYITDNQSIDLNSWHILYDCGDIILEKI